VPGELDHLIWPEIPSAVTPPESLALATLAIGKNVLECGAHYGYSTVLLASVVEHLTSVDWHRGDDHAGHCDSLGIYTANLDRYGVTDKVTTRVGRFEDELPKLAEEGAMFDGAFLDGMHDEESVSRDLELILKLVKPGGFVAFHDYGRCAENGHPGFAVTPVADKFGISGSVGFLGWGFVPVLPPGFRKDAA
jgi:hypothetical protein